MNEKRQKLEEFLACLHQNRFYEAHEVLETLWFPKRFEQNSEVKLLKGFINAAVSFELVKRGKIQASQKVWRNYLKYRPLLWHVDASYKNHYFSLSRDIEKIKDSITLKSHKAKL